jgi:hypothetical protein
MFERTFGASQLNLPTRIEIFGTRENDICMMLEENTTQMPKRYQTAVDEWSIE